MSKTKLIYLCMYACLWYWWLIIYVKLFSHEDQVLIDDKMHQWTVIAKRICDRSIVSSINPKFDNRFIVFCTSWELYFYLGYQFCTKMHWVDPLASTDLCSIWKQEFMVWSLSANLRLSAVTLKDHWKIQVKWLQGHVKNITQLA